MTSRIPPSQRDPLYAEQRASRALRQQTPGAGKVPAASPVLPAAVLSYMRSRPSEAAGGDTDHPGSGSNSTVIGVSATATATEATALGYSADATGASSVAIGTQTTASAGSAVAIGPLANATTVGAVAVGDSAQATGAQAAAFGYVAQASGNQSTALGNQSNASGLRTTVIGKSATCSVDDRCLIRNDDLELVRSSGSGAATSIILASPDGSRWRLVPPNGGGSIGWVAA